MQTNTQYSPKLTHIVVVSLMIAPVTIQPHPTTGQVVRSVIAIGAGIGITVGMYTCYNSKISHKNNHPNKEIKTDTTTPAENSWWQSLYQGYCLFKSASSFHISRLYNAWKFDKVFNFNRIAGDIPDAAPPYNDTPWIHRIDGNITSMHDAKAVPLVLGSIPGRDADIEDLKNKFNLQDKDSIGIITMNRPFERNWAGLTKVQNTRRDITVYEYPTTDYTVPSLNHTIKAVYQLENRDSDAHKLSYVHCKAGRGRSAFIVAAYLIHVLHKERHRPYMQATPAQIVAYIKHKRPHVSLHDCHMKALEQFKAALEDAGNIQTLHSQAMQ